MKNYIARTIFLLCILCLAVACEKTPVKSVVNVENADIEKILEERPHDITIIDIRTMPEYTAGHLPGAIHINMADPEFYPLLAAQAAISTGEWLIYCRSGNRTSQVLEKIREIAPGKNMYHMHKGIKTWPGSLIKGPFPFAGQYH